MDKKALQSYAIWAKGSLENQIEISLKILGIHSEKDIKKAVIKGDYTIIDGDDNSYPKELFDKRNSIITLIQRDGFSQTVEEFAYTWFNRFIALRFMEVHNYFSHGFRVLSSHDKGQIEPEILKNLNFVAKELNLNLDFCASLKEQDKIEDLYRYVLFHQCNSLGSVLPMLFSNESDYLELLLPSTLLKGDTIVTKLVEIDEENFLSDVEVVGWLYQFYISVKKDEVFATKKTITQDTLPSVTQLFTPDWIVRYMAENSIGRIWLESYPNSSLKAEMKYYVKEDGQANDSSLQIDKVKYSNVNPEEIKIIEPCCGSGHILVYAFDLLYKMYEEKGYQKREIPTLILSNNLVGLDIDKRAAQLANFALVMRARRQNAKFFSKQYYVRPKIYEIWDSRWLLNIDYKGILKELGIVTDKEIEDIAYIVDVFRDAKTIGSLLKIEPRDYDEVALTIKNIKEKAVSNFFTNNFLTYGINSLECLVAQAKVMSVKYDVVITNPPYISISTMEQKVKDYALAFYPNSKTDMFAMFMETEFVKENGFTAMINMHSWMFLSSFEKLRLNLMKTKNIITMAHLGTRAFEEIGGEVVQTTAFVVRNYASKSFGNYFRLVDFASQQAKQKAFLQALNDKDCKYKFSCNSANFNKIPGSPIAYWVSEKIYQAFEKGQLLGDIAFPKTGMTTGDNNRFLRLWYEINNLTSKINSNSCEDAQMSNCKWFPYAKGGGYKRWYGYKEYFINWKNNGHEIKNNIKSNGNKVASVRSEDLYFGELISWSAVTSGIFSCRIIDKGFLFDSGGSSIKIIHNKNYLLGFLNGVISQFYLNISNATINYQPGDIANLPVIIDETKKPQIDSIVEENIAISKTDWDSFETSWDFKKHPLI